jgi:hypothetical protein
MDDDDDDNDAVQQMRIRKQRRMAGDASTTISTSCRRQMGEGKVGYFRCLFGSGANTLVIMVCFLVGGNHGLTWSRRKKCDGDGDESSQES